MTTILQKAILKSTLDKIAAVRSPNYLLNDPLQFSHRYKEIADKEIVALIASSFAYGNVKIIIRSIETILQPMGNSPSYFIDTFDVKGELKRFEGFKHRFNDGRDLVALLWGIRIMREKCGSIGRFFSRFYDPKAVDLTGALNNFCAAILGLDYSTIFASETIPKDSALPFFFPSPRQGSACKRLCMFLRWVVRHDDGVDLGLWKFASPSQLIIPVDTHICRIARYLGLTSRTTADWKMALEITGNLRELDPSDPVKYDFALAHLGISDGCDGKDRLLCQKCGISNVCCVGNKIDTPPSF